LGQLDSSSVRRCHAACASVARESTSIERRAVVCSSEVFAANAQGPSALALAALTAEHDAAQGASQRIVIAKPFAGQVNFAYPAGRNGPAR
jgi:hypothetical protein